MSGNHISQNSGRGGSSGTSASGPSADKGNPGLPGQAGDAGRKSAALKGKAPAKSARRRSRELALQGLYQWLLAKVEGEALEAVIRDMDGFGKADRAHFDALLHGSMAQAADLDAALQPHLDRPSAQLSPIEHGCLLIGAYELKHCLEVPYRVVINEAVELAKGFGGTDGHKYVNGVLDKLAMQLRSTETRAAS